MAKKRDPFNCVHIGEYVADSLRKRCVGCGASVALTMVHTCAVHGRCSPLCECKDARITACKGCESWEAEA